MFLFNENLKKAGVFNASANLSDLDKNGDVKYKVDFKNIYATILDKWLEVDSKKILGKSFENLDFI